MTFATHWQAIRALRANPTGAAASDPDRKRTFVAALRQAEELAQASQVAGYATRALPLFYSLSQAGRAIAAVHLNGPWELHGHGLGVTTAKGALLETVVYPNGKADSSFTRVSGAVGSPILAGRAQLGALWAANPDLLDVPVPSSAGSSPRALEIPIGLEYSQMLRRGQFDPTAPTMTTGGLVETWVDIPGTNGQELTEALKPYPTLRGAFGVKQGGNGADPAGPADAVQREPDERGVMRAAVVRSGPTQTSLSEYWRRRREFASIVEIDERHPRYPYPHFVGFALPDIAGSESPHPLMLWWALLLGLSSLTRYEPAAWTAAIDLDASELAVSLERVLDIAEEKVPKRILQSM